MLVEADLPFKATAGLHHAQPTPGADPDRPVQHGFLNLLVAVEALVDGASVADAADVLRDTDPSEISARGATRPSPGCAAGSAASAAAACWTRYTTWSPLGLVEEPG